MDPVYLEESLWVCWYMLKASMRDGTYVPPKVSSPLAELSDEPLSGANETPRISVEERLSMKVGTVVSPLHFMLGFGQNNAPGQYSLDSGLSEVNGSEPDDPIDAGETSGAGGNANGLLGHGGRADGDRVDVLGSLEGARSVGDGH